ncbi:MAG: glutathione S-transferase [Rhodospirillales bacterium]|jgi:glutathione S-transferase|nr:glutathione S-transferase [Rhodospirillales bacterium]
MTYTLYWNPGKASFAPHALLAESSLDYTLVNVDIDSGESHTAKYLAINPAGYVPALKLPDGSIMYEAAAIMLYLADHHELREMAPAAGDSDRALFLRSLFYLTNTVQDSCKAYYYAHRYSTDEADAARIKDRAVQNLDERWKVVEDHLAANGPYHLGERYSLVDIYMTMLADWYPGNSEEFFARNPSVKRCSDLVTARPVIIEVMKIDND